MRQIPKPGEIYKHFKGNCYRIITVATHSETGEKLVIYQALYGGFGVYARELTMFMGPVDKGKYPDAVQEMRFEPVESGAVGLLRPEEAPAEFEAADFAKEAERKEEHAGKEAEDDRQAVPDRRQSPEKATEPQIDPMVLAYLDAGTCKEKLQILTNMKGRLTDGMINTMAIAIDVEIKPGDITERYEELKYCLATRERFECRRLR